jgi:CheY-like chemotaxis protein
VVNGPVALCGPRAARTLCALRPPASASLESGSGNATGPYVLVVDDDPAVRELYATALREASMEVVEAIDGLAALQLVRTRPPAAIVTDVEMPGLDGLALSRLVRRDAQTREIPIVIVSSHGGSTAFAAVGGDAGGNTVLRKPCSLATLRSVVSAYVEGWSDVSAVQPPHDRRNAIQLDRRHLPRGGRRAADQHPTL